MKEEHERTKLLIGDDGIETLKKTKVCIFGVGGVGGYVVEALARAGIGNICIVDKDVVSVSNINRQIIALQSTVGKPKVQVMKERIADISPDTLVEARQMFYLPENSDDFEFSEYDYIIDAIDNVTAKIDIIVKCKQCGTPIISSMGTGNKLHPELFEISDIYKTQMCPLAKVMRRELKARQIKRLKVVYSKEEPVYKGRTPGSISFVPSIAGLLIAGEVIRDVLKIK